MHAAAQGLTHRVTAWSKSVRYAQQSLSLAVGALLGVVSMAVELDGLLSKAGLDPAQLPFDYAIAFETGP